MHARQRKRGGGGGAPPREPPPPGTHPPPRGGARGGGERREGGRRKKKLPRGVSTLVRWDRVVKIEKLPPEDVYDVEIAGTHNFVANGIVAHNTYLGTVSASGLATLGQASTTLFSSYGPAYFGSTAAP